jgi:hypothetical protein
MKGLFIISLLCTTVHTGRAHPLPDIILISLVALLLFVATITALWEIEKKINPAEAKTLDLFLIFAVVFVPFFMVIYFGMAIVVYEATAASQPNWPTWPQLSVPIQVGLAVIYFAVTTWLWFCWHRAR